MSLKSIIQYFRKEKNMCESAELKLQNGLKEINSILDNLFDDCGENKELKSQNDLKKINSIIDKLLSDSNVEEIILSGKF